MRAEPRLMSQELWALHVFCTVAEEQSVSLAARRLALSQPGVSMAIRRLEQRYWTRFIVRRGNGVILTPAGFFFYQHAVTALRSAWNLQTQLRALQQGTTGRVTLATRPSLSTHYLPPVLTQFWRGHPDVEVRVVIIFARVAVLGEVLDGGVEFAVLPRGGGVVVQHGIAVEPFHREPLVIVAAPDHPLAQDSAPSLARIAREPFIVNSREYSQIAHLDDRFRAGGYGPLRIAMEVSGDGAKELVRAGVGLSLMLRCTVEDELARGDLRAIAIPGWSPAMDFVLVYYQDPPLSPLADQLAQLMRARAHTHPPD